jgi:hypothetical protein
MHLERKNEWNEEGKISVSRLRLPIKMCIPSVYTEYCPQVVSGLREHQRQKCLHLNQGT